MQKLVRAAVGVLAIGCSASPDSDGRTNPGGGQGPNPGTGGAGSDLPGTGRDGMGFNPSQTGGATGAGGSGFEQCAGISAMAEGTYTETLGADIIIAIDQSSSMNEETVWVQQQLNTFANMVAGAGVSLRVVIIVEKPGGPVFENPICVPPPLALPNCESNPPQFLHINHHVDSNDAFDVILATYPQYAHVLRPGVTKHVVVITDDAPGAVPANVFDQQFMALDPPLLGGYIFHAVVPFDAFCPFADGPSDQYTGLVVHRGGWAGDLCLQDFQTVWNALTQSLTQSAVPQVTLGCEWTIPPAPDGQVFDSSLVNVTYTGSGQQKNLGKIDSPADCANFADAWFYDDPANPTQVVVCPDLCDEIRAGQGQRVDIVFGCEAVTALPR